MVTIKVLVTWCMVLAPDICHVETDYAPARSMYECMRTGALSQIREGSEWFGSVRCEAEVSEVGDAIAGIKQRLGGMRDGDRVP